MDVLVHTVQNNGNFLSMAFIQDVVHQSGLARAQIAYMTLTLLGLATRLIRIW